MLVRWIGRALAAATLAATATPALAAGAATLTQNDLLGVSCAGPHACLAVGAATAKKVSPIIEQLRGATWSLVPATSLPKGSELNGVSCPTATWCAIVGGDAAGSLIATYSGSSLTAVKTPASVPLGTKLLSVDCRSTVWCDAVGSAHGEALIVQLRGTTWKFAPAPSPNKNQVTLTSVSCASTATCMTVGYAEALYTGVPKAVALWFHAGKWQKVAMTFSGKAAEPRAVSCPSAAWCAAVGGSNGIAGPAVSLFSGAKWAAAAAPTGQQLALVSVDCVAAASCVAVANGSGGRFARLAGTAWSTASFTPLHAPDTFSQVACWSRTGCVAVGYDAAQPYGATRALVATWLGGAWTLREVPNLR